MDTHFKENYNTKYKKLNLIGYGEYTEVYKAKNKKTREIRTLIIVKLSKYKIDLINSYEDVDTKLEQFKQNLIREINIMKKCAEHNENSVKYYESFETEDEFAIVSELCDENLNIFKNKRNINSEEIYEILNQLNNTFKIMKETIVHRDLKPLNILIKYDKNDKSKYTVKLCDFGISKEGIIFNLKTAKENRGTTGYIAPEIMEKILALEIMEKSTANEIKEGKKEYELIKRSQNYDYKKCDLWSLGIIIYELLFEKKPYDGINEQSILNQINSGKKILKKTNNEKLDDLINKLLEKDPEKRIGWDDYFNHPFFRKEIKIIYKRKIKNINKIRIFGKKFVENNKDKCKIIYKEKEYLLTEFLDIKEDEDLLELKLFPIDKITDMSNIFCNCDSIESLPDLSDWNTNKVTNMSFMFFNCGSLEYLPDISNLNTNNVTDMSKMFFNCHSLKTLPDISKWNTNKVTNMKFMFGCCENLKSLPDISKWDTSSVTDMSYMFFNCHSLESLPDISKWDINNVTIFRFIFQGSQFPLNNLSKFIK